MTMQWLLASLHLIALGIGLAGIWARARAFARLGAGGDVRDVFAADNLWGIAALLWLATGLARAFAGFEKGSDYYLGSTAFWIKMSLFVLVCALEIWPMVTLIRWRSTRRRGEPIDLGNAATFARISRAQLAITAAMIFVATAMARGFLR